MRTSRGWLVFLAVLMVLGSGTAVLAADAVSSTITLELKDVDIRSAIEALFRMSGKNFNIDQNVQGTVSSLSFKDVPFETALKNLTKVTGLVYRQDGGVYIISKRPDTTATMQNAYGSSPVPDVSYVDQPTTSEMQIEKIPLNYTSASEILAVMSGSGRDFATQGMMGGGRYGAGGYYGGGGSPYGGGGYNQYGGGGYSPYGGGGYNQYGGGGYSPYGGGYGSYGNTARTGYGGYGGYGNTGGYRGW